ncbi:hypothetical protein M9H77_13778 [Catharanthus roseus]|uniref:Uncharacterized protein n=1 Tax=Catharanthus roseus TaxID=4058 RepID=A0ACC0BL65_CATRO|nr:hypothetical protein M9H77_13778 [Catharanthus roseus]
MTHEPLGSNNFVGGVAIEINAVNYLSLRSHLWHVGIDLIEGSNGMTDGESKETTKGKMDGPHSNKMTGKDKETPHFRFPSFKVYHYHRLGRTQSTPAPFSEYNYADIWYILQYFCQSSLKLSYFLTSKFAREPIGKRKKRKSKGLPSTATNSLLC